MITKIRIYFWAHGCWWMELSWIWLFLCAKHILNIVVGCTKIPFFTIRCIQSFDFARKNITLDLLLSFCATILLDYLSLVGWCWFFIIIICLIKTGLPNADFERLSHNKELHFFFSSLSPWRLTFAQWEKILPYFSPQIIIFSNSKPLHHFRSIIKF